MKFSLYGATFDDIEQARRYYCDLFWLDGSNNCTKCRLSLDNNEYGERCIDFCKRHTEKAISIMRIETSDD